MFRNILVPLDGSMFGEHALPIAVSIARRAGAQVHLVHVHVPVAPVFGEYRAGTENTFDPALKRAGQVYLDKLVKRLANGVAVTPTLLEGTSIGAAIQEHAASVAADLIVMTTHGRGPLARAWLGSVADDLVRRTPLPLLLVRPQDSRPNVGAEIAIKHVLVPLDGSPFAEGVLAPVLDLGGLTRADYTLLRVLRPALAAGFYDVTYPGGGWLDAALLKEMEALDEKERRQATAYLQGIADHLRARSVQVQTQVTVDENPAVAILKEAKEHAADLIALETHGRAGLPRLVLGSVADKVLRGTSIPVLVHHAAREQPIRDPRLS
jgi:nucleotide-binding universal stress UspA family protein